MIDCLYFVQSNKEYHSLMDFLLKEVMIKGIDYLIFSENVKIIDGRMFYTFKGYLLAINFLSYASDLEVKLESVGLGSTSLVNFYDVVCKDENPLTKAITIRESTKTIIFERKLEKFVADQHFIFKDGSALTIPEVCRRLFIDTL